MANESNEESNLKLQVFNDALTEEVRVRKRHNVRDLEQQQSELMQIEAPHTEGTNFDDIL